MSQGPVRRLRVILPTLAAVPLLAQTPCLAQSPIFSQNAETLRSETPKNSQESANAVRSPAKETAVATHPAAEKELHDALSHIKNRKKFAKYDVSEIGNRHVGEGVNFYSSEKEQELGRELASELERHVRLIDDSVVTEYVNRVGQNLVRNSDAKVPFTIKVIDDDEMNAFALPGGFLYVNSGLILATDNEAELASVMAHEIAHVACRHVTKAMTKNRISKIASIPLLLAGGPAGQAIVAIAMPISSLKLSRDTEREADLLGLQYQYAAGYDPNAFVQFFERISALQKQEKHSVVFKLLLCHPATDDRIRRAQYQIGMLLPPRELYVVSTSEFDEAKSRLAQAAGWHGVDHQKGNRPALRRRVSDRIPARPLITEE